MCMPILHGLLASRVLVIGAAGNRQTRFKCPYFSMKPSRSGSGVSAYSHITLSHESCKISSILPMLDVGACVTGSRSMTRGGVNTHFNPYMYCLGPVHPGLIHFVLPFLYAIMLLVLGIRSTNCT